MRSPAVALALSLALWVLLECVPRRGPKETAAPVLRPVVPDLNRSPPRHLVFLPNVGPARAAAIVEERGRAPFSGVGDVVRVKGIGPKTAAALEGIATATGPSRP